MSLESFPSQPSTCGELNPSHESRHLCHLGQSCLEVVPGVGWFLMTTKRKPTPTKRHTPALFPDHDVTDV